MKKITYRELCSNMYKFNEENKIKSKGVSDKKLRGVIVFTENSFEKEYSLESRSYKVNNDNKAWIAGMSGYSIYGSALDGSDPCVRLEQVMKSEYGGADGWDVDYCYMLDENGEPV